MSYARQVIKLDFPELSEDPQSDPIWVVIKNPKLLPPKMLRSSNEAQAASQAVKEARDAGGKPSEEDADTAEHGTHEMAGKLIVAWRVYDPSSVPEIDPLTGEVTGDGQALLPPPSGGGGASPDQFAALPSAIQVRVLQEITEALNPLMAQEGPTSKTSSGSPSPSTTEPGAVAQ